LVSAPEVWDLGDAGQWWVASFLDPDGARLHLFESVAAARAHDGAAEPVPPLGHRNDQG
jgi:hypothetical protein